jgi:hypothetical protein
VRSSERFHPLTGIPLSQALLGAIFGLSARYIPLFENPYSSGPGKHVIAKEDDKHGAAIVIAGVKI